MSKLQKNKIKYLYFSNHYIKTALSDTLETHPNKPTVRIHFESWG